MAKICFGGLILALALPIGFLTVVVTNGLIEPLINREQIDAGEPIELEPGRWVVLEPDPPEAADIVIRDESGEQVDLLLDPLTYSFDSDGGALTFDRPVTISTPGPGGFAFLLMLFALFGWFLLAVCSVSGVLLLRSGLKKK